MPAKRSVVAFHEGLAWVAQLITFLTLGLLVFPSQLGDVWLEGTILALLLAVVARPVATYLATVGAGFTLAERTALGGPACAGRSPWFSPRSRCSQASATAPRSSTSCSWPCSVSTVLQGMTFEPRRQGPTGDHQPPGPATAPAETGTIRGTRRRGRRVPGLARRCGRRCACARPRPATRRADQRDRARRPRGAAAGLDPHRGGRPDPHGRKPGRGPRARGAARPLAPRARGRHAAPAAAAPRRPPRLHGAALGVRDGDPGDPRAILGIPVVEHLRSRNDRPGALVALDDGRYAVSGPLLAVGSAAQIQAHARKRAGLAGSDGERAWWQEVIGAVAVEGAGRGWSPPGR